MLAASAHLTDRDRDLVRLVAVHRVLTTGQLTALGFGNLTTVRHRLSALVRLGLLRRFRPHPPIGSAPWHNVLGPTGAMLGVEDRDEKRWAPHVRADRQLALERSGRLAHLTDRNWFFAALARHARQHGGELREWLNEADAAARYEHTAISRDDRARLPRPDAAGTWAQDGRVISFLLEYDTGTEHLAAGAALRRRGRRACPARHPDRRGGAWLLVVTAATGPAGALLPGNQPAVFRSVHPLCGGPGSWDKP